MTSRETKFLAAVLPLLIRLDGDWFPPDKKTDDGGYFACTYCDMGCGGHKSHDPDCLAQLAKDTLAAFIRIEHDNKFEKDIMNLPRPENDVFALRESSKVRYLVTSFYGIILNRLIPLDYRDPDNENVGCSCNLFSPELRLKNHEHDCVMVGLANAISELFNHRV
jgi:hypothetical protein